MTIVSEIELRAKLKFTNETVDTEGLLFCNK